jgi:hypothetical protein
MGIQVADRTGSSGWRNRRGRLAQPGSGVPSETPSATFAA